MREVDPAVSGLCEVGPAVTGPCEVDSAVSGLCEVGPAETGLARSASCRSDGGLVLEPGRKRVVVRCCLVTAVKPVGLKSTGAARERNRSCDFTAHMCTGIILSNYKSFVNPLFKLISIEHVIIGSRTQWKTM